MTTLLTILALLFAASTAALVATLHSTNAELEHERYMRHYHEQRANDLSVINYRLKGEIDRLQSKDSK